MEDMVTFSMRFPKEQLEELEAIRVLTGQPTSEFVRDSIQTYLEQRLADVDGLIASSTQRLHDAAQTLADWTVARGQ